MDINREKNLLSMFPVHFNRMLSHKPACLLLLQFDFLEGDCESIVLIPHQKLSAQILPLLPEITVHYSPGIFIMETYQHVYKFVLFNQILFHIAANFNFISEVESSINQVICLKVQNNFTHTSATFQFIKAAVSYVFWLTYIIARHTQVAAEFQIVQQILIPSGRHPCI